MYKNGNPNYNEKIFTQIESDDIKQMYLNGYSSVYIGNKYGVCHKVILKHLKKLNITINQRLSMSKYNLNENYFDIIDTPNKAYILGFLYADGYNNLSKCTISISLQEDDVDILNKMKDELCSNRELEYIDYSNKHDFGYNYKNQYRLRVFSAHMCSTLNDIGMVQNKSLILKFPNISYELYKHFIRGYFDGDGSYCGYYTKSNKFQPLITFTSTNEMCKSIKNVLSNELNIPCGNIYDASCHNGVTKVLSISGKNQVKLVLDWLYEDADMFLERKYQKFFKDYYMNKSLLA